MQHHERTEAYAARRTAKVKIKKKIFRCMQRLLGPEA
jgi:hypothetical protein